MNWIAASALIVNLPTTKSGALSFLLKLIPSAKVLLLSIVVDFSY
jgi:hypothetical protein